MLNQIWVDRTSVSQGLGVHNSHIFYNNHDNEMCLDYGVMYFQFSFAVR